MVNIETYLRGRLQWDQLLPVRMAHTEMRLVPPSCRDRNAEPGAGHGSWGPAQTHRRLPGKRQEWSERPLRSSLGCICGACGWYRDQCCDQYTYWYREMRECGRRAVVERANMKIFLPATYFTGPANLPGPTIFPGSDLLSFQCDWRIFSPPPHNLSSLPTMNNLLEKAKSMSKVVVDSGAKTMLKVRMESCFGCGC